MEVCTNVLAGCNVRRSIRYAKRAMETGIAYAERYASLCRFGAQRADSTRLGALSGHVFGVERTHAAQSERQANAASEHWLIPSVVSHRAAHQAINGEYAAVFPLRYRLRVIGRDQVPTQDLHNSRRRVPACSAAMILASGPVLARNSTPSASAGSNKPAMRTAGRLAKGRSPIRLRAVRGPASTRAIAARSAATISPALGARTRC